MPDTEVGSKPYRYSRSFELTAETKLQAEMDPQALNAYIKEILGIMGSESKSTKKEYKPL